MRLEWDNIGEKYYETGTSHGVFYKQNAEGNYLKGVVWNGLTGVTESPSGAEPSDLYADDIKYATLRSAETFGATIEAYTYPDEFMECDGTAEIIPGVYAGQQSRPPFGFCYKTKVGNDTVTENDDGYKLHIIYNATASPSEKGYTTESDSPEAVTLSWELATTPVRVPGHKPTATIVIDSRKVVPQFLTVLENILYGTETEDARLPLPSEIYELYESIVFTKVKVPAKDTLFLGKAAQDLQKNIKITKYSISGSLKHVTDYTGFSSEPSEQEGHYLALKFKCNSAHFQY